MDLLKAVTLGQLFLLSCLPQLAVSELFTTDNRYPLHGSRPPPGSPWPMPSSWQRGLTTLTFKQDNLTLTSNVAGCYLVSAAFDRLMEKLAQVDAQEEPEAPSQAGANIVSSFAGDSSQGHDDHDHDGASVDEDSAHGRAVLRAIRVHVDDVLCPWYPGLDMKEDYKIHICRCGVRVNASSVWGIIRGFETLGQLMYKRDGRWLINAGDIEDSPRFGHRGLMLDTATHFYDLDTIKTILDMMSMNKLNVFHWNMVGAQAFPYESWWYPDLAEKGAYSPSHMYTVVSVNQIIEYARLRGIRVIPEFNTPGLSQSWTKSGVVPSIQCSRPCPRHGSHDITWSAIDPLNSDTYVFLADFFWEVTLQFPDDLLHMGMRDSDHDCWASQPELEDFMSLIGLNETDLPGLESFYSEELVGIAEYERRKPILWEDPLINGATVSDKAIIQLYKKDTERHQTWREALQTTLEAGYDVVFSSCWDLSTLSHGEDWKWHYLCNPGEGLEENLVPHLLGGEVTLWGDNLDAANVIQAAWAGTAAVAERLWSPMAVTDCTDTAQYRLDQHRCRMLRQGIQASPIGPGFCRHGEYNTDNSLPDGGEHHQHQHQQSTGANTTVGTVGTITTTVPTTSGFLSVPTAGQNTSSRNDTEGPDDAEEGDVSSGNGSGFLIIPSANSSNNNNSSNDDDGVRGSGSGDISNGSSSSTNSSSSGSGSDDTGTANAGDDAQDGEDNSNSGSTSGDSNGGGSGRVSNNNINKGNAGNSRNSGCRAWSSALWMFASIVVASLRLL